VSHGLFSILLSPLLAIAFSASALPAATEMPVTFGQVTDLGFREPDDRLDYGEAASQHVLIWRSNRQQISGAPLVVLLHGGCWLSQYSVDHIFPLATALSDAGFAVWAPEYRRVGESGGGWPGTFEDIAEAMGLLTGPGFDIDRVVLVGHSAGGHLALWAGAHTAFDRSKDGPAAVGPELLAVIGLAAISDLASYSEFDGSCPQAVAQLMGGVPRDLPDRYQEASPANLSLPVPVVLLQGSGDPIVPPSQAEAMPGARVRMLEGAGHFDLIHPGTTAFDVLLGELEQIQRDD
jgi:acetyl esterase/lipase